MKKIIKLTCLSLLFFAIFGCKKEPVVISSIEVTPEPKSEFHIYEYFDENAYTVTATYSDNSTRKIDIKNVTITKPVTTEVCSESKQISFTYEGKTLSYDYTVSKTAINDENLESFTDDIAFSVKCENIEELFSSLPENDIKGPYYKIIFEDYTKDKAAGIKSLFVGVENDTTGVKFYRNHYKYDWDLSAATEKYGYDYPDAENSWVRNVYLSKDVEELSRSSYIIPSTRIFIDKENPIYEDVDGILYKKADGKTILKKQIYLICREYPVENNTFTVPDDIDTLDGSSFANTKTINTVNIPKTVLEINNFAFNNYDYMTINNSKARTINYAGSEEEWNAIFKGTLSDNITIYFNVQF